MVIKSQSNRHHANICNNGRVWEGGRGNLQFKIPTLKSDSRGNSPANSRSWDLRGVRGQIRKKGDE